MFGSLEIRAFRAGKEIKAKLYITWGDINQDGVVDNSDYDLIKASYGYTKEHPEYDEKLDLNRDGRIDLVDGMIATGNDGLKSPKYVTPYKLPQIAEGKYFAYAYFEDKTLTEPFEIIGNQTTKLTFEFGRWEFQIGEMFSVMFSFMMLGMMMTMMARMMEAFRE